MNYYEVVYYIKVYYKCDDDDYYAVKRYDVQSPSKDLVKKWCQYNTDVYNDTDFRRLNRPLSGEHEYELRRIDEKYKIRTIEEESGPHDEHYHIIYSLSYELLNDSSKWKDIICLTEDKVNSMIADMEDIERKVKQIDSLINEHNKKIENEKKEIKAVKRKHIETESKISKKWRFS